ncbi:MAG TPA: ribosomal protein S18-alanine N-acetyltransferase [Burkholderiales bacterium]|nr:ribosomal protein S18-alanine N-acetyltransferase [Burkholderiales bacterium]
MSARLAETTTYRRMEVADLERVVPIERALHAHPWTRGNFADSIDAGYHCWIVERAGHIVGYGVVTIAAGEAHLLNLSVAGEWQRRGIGTELSRFFLKLAHDYGAAKMYLEVRPSNAAARALYLQLGFAEIGVRRDYYPAPGAPEDAVVMELNVP